jgi:hypothetical protein
MIAAENEDTNIAVSVKCRFSTVRMHNLQNRRCTYNVTWRRVRLTNVTVEKQSVLHILSMLPIMQIACAVLYCYLCPVRLYHIFLHYLI